MEESDRGERHGFAEQEDLHFVPRFREGVSMQERKRGLRRYAAATRTWDFAWQGVIPILQTSRSSST
jgi:hypothetical protein